MPPAAAPTILPADRTRPLPLSFSQARLWFLDQFTPNQPTYNVPVVIDVTGPLDVGAFERALSEVLRRHEALRTTFPAVRGVPSQVVQPHVPKPLPLIDLTSLDAASQSARVDEAIHQSGRQLFDLATGPVFRASLITLGPEHHVFVANVHHIVFDMWSGGVFARELSAFYVAYKEGSSPTLPDLPVQFADYAAWQQARFSGDRLAQEVEWWKRYLGEMPRLMLPTDFARPPIVGNDGAREYLMVSDALVNDLEALARKDGCTLFVALLSTYAMLLSHISGQEDFIVGVPVANRSPKEVESLVGFFLNTLPLRLDVSGAPSFRDLLRRNRQSVFGAYAHQELPFEKLVDAVRPERSLNRSPLFETMLSVDTNPESLNRSVVAGDVRLRRRLTTTGTAKFDVSLLIVPTDDGRRLTLEYRVDLFEAATARRWLAQYAELLARVVAEPESSITALLAGLGGGQHSATSSPVQGRHSTYPRQQSISELVEANTRRRPKAVAVVSDDVTLSYGELDERANRLAHRLIAAGAGLGSHVGVCLPRSVDTVVTLLAVAKAGGAYVPLDPNYPPPRLRLMIERAGVSVIVTTSPLARQSGFDSHAVVALDGDPAAAGPQDGSALAAVAGPDDLAYVLFTSGTTGEPKMVGVPHRPIARLAYGMPDLPFGEGARVLHASPLGFDLSTFEIWVPLLRGGSVVIPGFDIPTPVELESCLRRHQVTVLWLTASLFNLIIDERPQALSGTRFVVAGGEALSVDHVRRAHAALPGTTFVNGYGPTEATTFATYHMVSDQDTRRASIPIGRPLDNTLVYVLDEERRPVAPGAAGELWIGGDALAVGYLGDAQLTAERFVADPFAGPGARMYRSGDRARYLADGTIEFLGRFDDQVKLRGFRIEPGEIEAALARHPQIERAAVAVHDLPGLGRTLVGHYVAADVANPPAARDLRAFLHSQLPRHMVPPFFESLPHLPLRPNGKLDRRALRPPADHSTAPGSDEPPVPLGPTEAMVAQVWGELLGLDRAGRSANFFELGGDSLRAAQLVGRLGDATSVTLPVRAVFEFPTIAGLAKLIDEQGPRPLTVPPQTADQQPSQRMATHEAPSAQTPTTSESFAAGEIEAVLADVWRQVLNVPALDIDDNFFERGGHSLLAVRLVSEIAARFGVDVPLATLFQHGTIRTQARLLRQRDIEPEWSPLVAIQPQGSKPPLFLVHGIGGEVLSYGILARHLGADQPIYGLRAQTRPEHGVWPTVEEMAARYIAAIRRMKPAGPYRIGGYSGGALVAYEMARQLMESGDGVAFLVMLDRGNPRSRRQGRPLVVRLARLPLRMAHWLADDDLLRGGLRNAIGRLHSKLVRWRGAVLGRVAGHEAAAVDIRHQLGVWRFPEESREFLANLSRALQSYRPGAYAGPMLVVRARSGRLFSTAIPTPDLGWRELASGDLRSELIAGAHDTIMMEPRISRLAEVLRRHLDTARD